MPRRPPPTTPYPTPYPLPSPTPQPQVAIQGIRAINSFPMEITYKDNKYTFHVTRIAPDRIRLAINGQVRD